MVRHRPGQVLVPCGTEPVHSPGHDGDGGQTAGAAGQGRWRRRIRGAAAEEILAEALPYMSSRTRARAEAALARIASDA